MAKGGKEVCITRKFGFFVAGATMVNAGGGVNAHLQRMRSVLAPFR